MNMYKNSKTLLKDIGINTLVQNLTTKIQYTVKPVLRDHIKQDIFLAFQTGSCLLLHESSAERFLHYFYAAISNYLPIP